MQKYIILLIILISIIVFLFCLSYETFQNTEMDLEWVWSKNWTDKDFKSRKGANCNPISKEYIDDFVIYTMPKSCEQGLPHTRNNNVIAIPEGFPEARLNGTIEHEKIHLHQKKYPNLWKKFYLNKWKYQIYDSPPSFIPSSLITNKRANPDTGDEPWCCWNNRWWSVPVYKDYDLSLSQAPIKWYDQQTNKIFDNPPKEWIEFFGNDIFQLEHPHEISAVLLSANKKNNTPAEVVLFNSWDKKLKVL